VIGKQSLADVRFAPESGQIRYVRFVPKADILQCGRNWHYSITAQSG
jgi:hypothetical protein